MQAYRIIRAEEQRRGRTMLQRGKIRTVDFLAVPRGDAQAAPMIPEVALLWEKLEAVDAQQQRILSTLGRVVKKLGGLSEL